ncbi:MAG: ATP-binding protein [Bacteroidota bacterium]
MKEDQSLSSLSRIFLLLVIVLTICLVGAFYYVSSDTRQDRIRDLSYTASVIKRYYEISFKQWGLTLQSLGKRLMEIETDSARERYADAALRIYQNELLAFGLAKPDGETLVFRASYQVDSLIDLTASSKTKRSFLLAKESKTVTLGECYYFGLVEDWIWPVRMPIYDEKENLIAVNTSGINYQRLISDLDDFGFNPDFSVHIINQDFGTTQLKYPLEEVQYRDVLGSDQYRYTGARKEVVKQGFQILEADEPFDGLPVLAISSFIEPINHEIIVSLPKTILKQEIFDRLKIFLIAYFILLLGSALLFVFVRRNMTKSLAGERNERANLESMIESTNEIFGLFDRNFKLVAFNSAFDQAARINDGKPLHKGMNLLEEMSSGEHSKRFRSYFMRAFKGEKFNVMETYPAPDGSELIYEFTYNPTYHEGEVVGLSFFAKDVTKEKHDQAQLEKYNKNLEKLVNERTEALEEKNRELTKGYEKIKETQQQLIKAEKMASLGVLAAGIGHEINNPLNFIRHGAEGLEVELKKWKGYPENKASEFFHAIYEGVNRSAEIVQGISHFSRGGSKLDEKCDLEEILNNSLSIAGTRFNSKQIEVLKSYDVHEPTILGSDGKLHQVFTNMIVNAEQAIKEKGTISLSITEDENSIHVSVQDDGIGMSKKTLKSLTDPFFTTKEPGEGTGLGLFISQMIIEEHNGKLEVSSTLGQGSRFTISFPKSTLA